MKRPATGRTLLTALLLVAAAAALARWVRGGGRPSVVIVTLDTTRADHLGCYGYGAAATPGVDALAAAGALFEDAAASSPLTLPSHTTILTGLHPPRHGMRDNDTPLALPPAAGRRFSTAAEIFRRSGYATGAFVSGSPLAPRWGLDAGFDRYDAPGEGEPGEIGLQERDGAATMGRVLGWLGARDRSRPFFLWVHLFDPHQPYAAPGGRGAPTDSVAAYDEEIAFADLQVRRLAAFLEEEGTLDRTVFTVTADHGEGLGDGGEATHGYFLHRATLRVPWILRYPRRVPGGTRVRTPVGLVDLLPTVLDLAGLDPPDGAVDGVSRVPGMTARDGDGSPPPSPAPLQYAETLYGSRSFGWAQSVTAREGDRQVIDHGGGRREVVDLAAGPGLGTPVPERPGDAETAARAWALFAVERAWTGPPGTDPGLGSIAYISAYAPLRPFGPDENGMRRLPSTSFVTRFLAAVRLLERAKEEESSESFADEIAAARDILDRLEREEPSNPAVPFWRGRAWALEARRMSAANGPGAATAKWSKAFFQYVDAGSKGYRDARTTSLMMQAAFMAGKYGDMLKVAEGATTGADAMDGDAGFWTLVASAWILGGATPDGRITKEVRTRAEEALERADARARSERERAAIEEVRGRIK